MNLLAMVLYLIAFSSIAVAIIQVMAARKENKEIIRESQTESGADPIKFRKALAKAFFCLGVFDIISASLILLDGIWVWPGAVLIVIGGIVFVIMTRSAQKINPMQQR